MQKKSGRGPKLGKLPKCLESPFIISATAEASDFKFGKPLRFTKARHKIPKRRKVGMALGYGSSTKFWSPPLIFLQRLKLATSNLVCSLGLPRPIIKSHQRKSGRGPKLGELPKFWGFSLIFLQRLTLATINLVCSSGLPRPIIKSHPEKKVGVTSG